MFKIWTVTAEIFGGGSSCSCCGSCKTKSTPSLTGLRLEIDKTPSLTWLRPEFDNRQKFDFPDWGDDNQDNIEMNDNQDKNGW